MLKKLTIMLVMGSGLLAGAIQPCGAEDLVSSFDDMSDESFSIQAIAPTNKVRELAVCKAVWFAEKKKVPSISLSNPAYDQAPRSTMGNLVKVPEGWAVLTATVYLTVPNPDGNPKVSVAERAAQCRKMWDWYR